MKRPKHLALRIALLLASLLLIAAGTGLLVLKSDWFHQKVRQRIVAELEKATGGTATLGDFVVDWGALTFEFQDLTLHGTEPPAAAPLFHARSIVVGLKIISFVKRDV